MIDLTAHQRTIINELASDYAVGVKRTDTDMIIAECYDNSPGNCVLCGQDENMHVAGHPYEAAKIVVRYKIGPRGWKQKIEEES